MSRAFRIEGHRHWLNASRIRALLRSPTESDYLVGVAATALVRASLLALALIAAVLTARGLGPDGRGLFAVAATIGAIGVQLGNLGIEAVFAGEEEASVPVHLLLALAIRHPGRHQQGRIPWGARKRLKEEAVEEAERRYVELCDDAGVKRNGKLREQAATEVAHDPKYKNLSLSWTTISRAMCPSKSRR